MSTLQRFALLLALALVVLLAVAFGVNCVLAWKSQARFDGKVADLRAAGQPASIGDLAPGKLPPEKNAAAILASVDDSLKQYGKESWTFEETDLGKAWDEAQQSGQLPTAEQLAEIEKCLNDHPEILNAIQQAAACNGYASLIDYSLPSTKFLDESLSAHRRMRELANFTSAKMIALQAEDKPDEAVQLGTQMLRLVRHCDNEPAIINYLVTVAVRGITFEALNNVLQRSQVTPQTRALLEAELAQQDNLKTLRHAMQTERAVAISNINSTVGNIPGMVRWPAQNWMTGQLELLDKACQAAQLPLEDLRPLRNPTPQQLQNPSLLADVAKDPLIGKSIMVSFDAEFRRLSQTRALRVLNALGEYRQRTGRDAESLDQLSLPKDTTIDPWTGEPLKLKKTEKGWLIYSVGKNATDDGGDFSTGSDEGLGPPGSSSKEESLDNSEK